eukprot:scaffold1744_cov340-Prasinococcus_capsulatus_cf.AAC.9
MTGPACRQVSIRLFGVSMIIAAKGASPRLSTLKRNWERLVKLVDILRQAHYDVSHGELATALPVCAGALGRGMGHASMKRHREAWLVAREIGGH